MTQVPRTERFLAYRGSPLITARNLKANSPEGSCRGWSSGAPLPTSYLASGTGLLGVWIRALTRDAATIGRGIQNNCVCVGRSTDTELALGALADGRSPVRQGVTRWQLFIRYLHIHYYYSVYHTRDMLFYLPKSQVGLPWFIPPRGIPMCVGPHPALLLVLH